MENQAKFIPYEQSAYFPHETADRQPPPHAIPRQTPESLLPQEMDDERSYADARTFPIPVTLDLVRHGRELFDVNCSACHGRDGYGQGIIVRRGFPTPPSFHLPALRSATLGHFYDVIEHGKGTMYPFGSRIAPNDRWAIISYIRALQFSQNASVSDLDPQDLEKLREVK